jgi:molecular chaperone GrpE
MSDQIKDSSNPATPANVPAAASASSRPATSADVAAPIEIDEPNLDIETAMREALSAVEAIEDPPGSASPRSTVDSEAGDPDEQEVAALRREIADLRDRSMRTLADFDNFRKRAERERQEVRRYALLEPLRDFLPIADNLERALQAGGSAEDLKRGVELILRQMQELLRRFGVREVAADGEVFNPAVHEAVARTESDKVTIPTVTETLVRGYMLHDRLLRPAIVKVAVPPERGGQAQPPSGGGPETRQA